MPRKRLSVERHEIVQPSDQSYSLIPLTQGQNAIVDSEDLEWLTQWNWFADLRTTSGTFVAKRNHPKGGPAIYMHREILRCRAHEEGDHANHDTLDNRKANLRLCSPTENARNRRVRKDSTTGLKGVARLKNGRWRTCITENGVRRGLGTYVTSEEAARAYDAAAKRIYGAFAVLNFPD